MYSDIIYMLLFVFCYLIWTCNYLANMDQKGRVKCYCATDRRIYFPIVIWIGYSYYQMCMVFFSIMLHGDQGPNWDICQGHNNVARRKNVIFNYISFQLFTLMVCRFLHALACSVTKLSTSKAMNSHGPLHSMDPDTIHRLAVCLVGHWIGGFPNVWIWWQGDHGRMSLRRKGWIGTLNEIPVGHAVREIASRRVAMCHITHRGYLGIAPKNKTLENRNIYGSGKGGKVRTRTKQLYTVL